MSVKFHLPGLRHNYPLNMLLVSLYEKQPEVFREGVKIASFFGEFPLSLWNGGRYSRGDQCEVGFIKGVIKNINEHGIPIRYTYTNPTITEEDLSDSYCNFCMKAADNGMNEVLVVSPILEKYIRENYPGFKINSSTCKEIRDIDSLNAELEKDYALVVLDYNLNNQFDILEKMIPMVAALPATSDYRIRIAEFFEDLADHIHPYNTSHVYLQKVEEIRTELQQMELPKTREEFNTQTALFDIVKSIEKYLIVKSVYKGLAGKKKA